MGSDFKSFALSDICSVIKRGISPKYTEDEGVPVLNQRCIRNYKISFENARFHDLDKKKIPEDRFLQDFDVLINSTGVGTLGRVAQLNKVNIKVTTDSHVTIVRLDNDNIDKRFFGWVLKYKQPIFESLGEGSTGQTELSRHLIGDLQVEVPFNKSIQIEIANVLDTIENKITLNPQINQTLEQMAQALFKSWFVDFDPVIDNALDAGNPIPDALAERAARRQAARVSDDFQPLPDDVRQLFPSEFEESELGWTPKGWECSFLNEVAEFGKERVSVNSLSLENYISTENMLQGKMGVEKASKLPTVSSVLQYKSGTILVSNIRPYFKKIWFAKGKGGYSNDVLGFEAKNQGTQIYVFNLLYQDAFFDYMMTTSKGSKMPRGDKKAIMDLKIIVPSISIMRYYSEKFEPVYEAAEIRRNENKALASIRDTLLPKLISGELRLDSPEVKKQPACLIVNKVRL
tara:strand:+ start:12052 stop:13431 length:1380 start_codon:yes stop_codon:yes gene_type:complete